MRKMSGPREPRRGWWVLVWFREEKCGVIVDLISDVDEGQPALVLMVRVQMSDVEQDIQIGRASCRERV